MTGPPRVTVFCPIYNDVGYAEGLLDSVLSQTMPDFDFIVFDNGSGDNVRRILLECPDPRVRVLTASKNLRSETSAKILSEIESEYIAVLFSDDLFVPDKLEIMLSALEREGADAAFSNNHFIDEAGDEIPVDQIPPSHFGGDVTTLTVFEHLYFMFFRGNSLHPVSMVIRRDAYRALGGFSGVMHQIGDMEFFVRLLLSKRVIFLPDKLQRIRIRTSRPNESTLTPKSLAAIKAERINLMAAYRSPEALRVVERIFVPVERGIVLPDTLRLWFFGQQCLQHPDDDVRLYGIGCIYEALKTHGPELENIVTGATGLTPGAYVETLTAKVFPV